MGLTAISNQGQNSITPTYLQTRGGDPFARPSSGTGKQTSDQVTISEEALRKSGQSPDTKQSKTGGTDSSKSGSKTSTPEETRKLEYLKNRDREVRAHEQAHVMAGGSLVRGGASFGYSKGPDGKLYAVSGEVSIDTSPVQDDPQATARKMIQVQKAALAPAQPSGQDRSVAAEASKTEMRAHQEAAQKTVKANQKSEPTAEKSATPSAKRVNTTA